MIHEGVIVTKSKNETAHITPLGVRFAENHAVLAPFRPSTTLANLAETRVATMNFIDDVRVIAGCLTGRRDFDLVGNLDFPVPRLACALTTDFLRVDRVEGPDERPQFYCTVERTLVAAPFRGYNRAQAAVVEAAILYSRVGMLPEDKMTRELAFHTIAIDKTAGPREQEAWGWLMAAFADKGVHPAEPASA